MTWNALKSWTDGEFVDSVDMNGQVRDNIGESSAAKVQAAGDLVVGAGLNALSRLAIGAVGQYLQVKGTGDGVEWAAGPSGSILQRVEQNLGADVALPISASVYTDIVSVSLDPGTWLVIGVCHLDSGASVFFRLKSSAANYASSETTGGVFAACVVSVVVAATTTITLAGRNYSTGATNAKAGLDGSVPATYIRALRTV